MQDQGKRLLVAVALALGVMLVWNTVFHKEEPPPDSAKPGQTQPKPATPQVGVNAPSATTGSGTPAATGSGSAPSESATPSAAKPAEELPRPPEEVLALPFPNVVAKFSSYCGGLVSWRLTDARYEHDATKGELLPVKAQMTMTDANGKAVPVPADQLVNLPECGAFDVNFASSSFVVPRHAVWKGEKLSSTEVRYTYAADALEIVKTFTVMPDKYLVRMALKITVRLPAGVEARQQLAVSVYSYQDPAVLKSGSSRVAPRAWSSSTMRGGEIVTTDVSGVLEWPRFEPAIQWTGFDHPYLLVGYAPHLGDGERVEKHTSAADGTHGVPRGFMRTDLLYLPATFKAGDAALTKEVVAYLGPKNYDNLAQADTAAGFATGFDKVVDLGWFAFIGRPLLWLLLKFHDVVGNWGIAIILLTFLVKALTLYWTTKSMRSMKAMAALAPQMKILQAKYADDKQRQQAETMALYKQHGVNPVAGCLPILLQMPVWLALYRMLSNAGELYQQAFIPGWINDLTATDPYYVLPAILVVTMFVQARLQPASVDSTQQKFLQYGMPLMFGVMSFFFPAGLTLYIFTNTVLSALHSIYMNKFDKKSLGIAQQLQKNKDLAAAELAGASKPGGKNGGPGKPRPVIEVKATEVPAGDDADDGAEPDDARADAAGTPGSGPARNRPRRKKRRR
ncbi:MAG TPA: membrane protein insertase YidC [Kofleriaceae bacterium]|nr:membrane protein insertase YidC [Kofleriaceae bacterium]